MFNWNSRSSLVENKKLELKRSVFVIKLPHSQIVAL